MGVQMIVICYVLPVLRMTSFLHNRAYAVYEEAYDLGMSTLWVSFWLSVYDFYNSIKTDSAVNL